MLSIETPRTGQGLNCYWAIFGEPGRPGKDPVESGSYTPHSDCATFSTSPGDLLLLYCTGSYPGLEKVSPGFGVVLGSNQVIVSYRYFPFIMPIAKTQIDKCLSPEEAAAFGQIRLPKYWLFKLSRSSFTGVVRDAGINWNAIN
jgi:hypothetical protein